MSDVVSGLLGRAVVAFEQHEEEDALLRLLEAWRESRSERLAALVERLSTRLAAGLPPLPGGHDSSHHSLQRPMDLPRMLGDLGKKASGGGYAEVNRQLHAWRRWPADPRLIPDVLAITRLPVVQAPWFLHELHELLVHLRDARCLAALRALLADLPPGHPSAAQLGQSITRLNPAWVIFPLSPEDLARCDALEASLTEREATEARSTALREALLARVHASPEDDGARMVLADLLLELGDPLGELIMLQCTPGADAARVDALLGKHRARWEGALSPSVVRGSVRFERGFPAAVRMEARPPRSPLPPPGPAWSTVQDIDWNWEDVPDAAEWLAHPHLRGVTRLRRVDVSLARRLGAYPLPVRRLELSGSLTRAGPDVFTTLSALPHLAWVRVQNALPEDVALCADSPLGPRLERFEASMMGAWSLVATPSAEVSVEATLVSELRLDALAAALRGAVGFGTRALRLRTRRRLATSDASRLKQAAAAYARIDWVHDG